MAAVAACALAMLVDAGTARGVSPEVEEMAKSVTIIRDQWGIAHIDAPTDAGAAFGFGYAQAQDNFWQVEETYAQCIRRYAEYQGEAGLESDLLNASFEITERAKAEFETADEDLRKIAIGFMNGINYYLEKHPETKPVLLTHFEPWWVLCYEKHVLMSFLYGQTHFGKGKNTEVHEEWRAHIGSNAWAIGPSKTKDGSTMLYCNPHQPWFGYGQFYEAHMRSGEGLNFSGAALPGGPLLSIGHNEYLGWTHTVNEPDCADVWIEKFDDPTNKLNYKHGDGYKTAREWTATIKIRAKDGTIEERTYPFRATHHGPIVGKQDDTHYFSANIMKLMDGSRARQALKMNKAKNLTEFKEAMGLLNLPMFNTVYADVHGDIFYLYNGSIPKRDLGFDWKKPVDGSNPDTDWKGLHPLHELPQLENPSSGYVQNCNSTPFTTTDDFNPSKGDFPSYMVEEKDNDTRRAKMARVLLRDRKDVTFEEWKEIALDTTLYWPMTEMPNYKAMFDRLKASADPDDQLLASKVEPYLNHLLNWDFKCSNESTQATLCMEWYSQLYEGFYPAETFKKIYVNDPKMRFDALLIAAGKLEKSWGSWQVPWGDIHRVQRHTGVSDFLRIPFSDKLPSVPCPGIHGPLGVAFTVYYAPPFIGRKKYYGIVGNSYMGAFEFGKDGRIKAGSLTQWGASDNPNSPHFMDQAEMMSRKEFKQAWFYWEDVEANAKEKYHPGEEVKG